MAKAKELIKRADSHRGERYILGARVPLDNPNWKGPWDCAEFISWVVYQATGLMVGCVDNGANPALAEPYSGAWARDAARSTRMIGLGQARGTAGAVLVRKPGQNGIGHVALSRGDGTTIEAHSADRGVTNENVDGRRWDLAMLLPLIDYPELAVKRGLHAAGRVGLALDRPADARRYRQASPEGAARQRL